jgi:hypothetical protein
MAYSGPVFSFEHNWLDPVIEGLAWLTNVMPRKSDSEQRVGLRKYPRRSLEYRALLSSRAMRARFDAFMELYQGEQMLVPVWSDAEQISAPASGDTIALTTAFKDYDAGAYVLLQRDYQTYEAVEIDSIDATNIYLTEDLDETWPIGTKILPARPGYLASETKGTRIARDIKDVFVAFDIDPLSVSTNRFATLSPLQIQSVDLFFDHTETGDPQELASTVRRLRTDFETGAIESTLLAPAATNRIGHRQLMSSRTEIANFLGFLARRKGRKVPFWTPAYGHHFNVTQSLTNEITITDEMYQERFAAGIARKYMVRPSAAGAVLKVGKTSAVVDNGNGTETLTLIGSEPGTAPVKISLTIPLRYCRLDADAIELQWMTSSVVDARLAFREMFVEAPG